MPNYTTEIAIIGGGICGLWILNLLRDRGYDACLIERSQLGGAQTLASQGMIHGGIKYTLGGFTTPASETIASMPRTWQECILGKGALDLVGLPILSDDYYLFSDGALSGKITAFFASKSLRGRIATVEKDQRPEAFNHSAFTGHLYKLQDMVVDTSALIKRLASRYSDHIFQADTQLLNDNGNPKLILEGNITLSAKTYILAAGEGNGELSRAIAGHPIDMQTRPLKQVMIKGALPEVYAHAVSLKDASKPRLTITTHAMPDGDNVWYLGGNLAEQGVHMSDDEVIAKARTELKKLLPWVETSAMPARTLDVNRAEPSQNTGSRPDFPFVKKVGDVVTCWPTKLTLTPMLGDEVLKCLSEPSRLEYNAPQLPLATIAPTPWEIAFA